MRALGPYMSYSIAKETIISLTKRKMVIFVCERDGGRGGEECMHAEGNGLKTKVGAWQHGSTGRAGYDDG